MYVFICVCIYLCLSYDWELVGGSMQNGLQGFSLVSSGGQDVQKFQCDRAACNVLCPKSIGQDSGCK